MKGTKWSQDEIEYLEKNYPHKDNRSLGNEMGRSELALRTKAYRLEITNMYDWRTNKPLLVPSPSLSYLIGVVFGDGSVNMMRRKTGRTNYNIDLDVKDRDFIDTFNDALHDILGKYYSVNQYDGRYQVRGQSKVLYFLLKDRDIDSLRKFIEPFPADFIKGFADSEGWITIYNNNGYKGVSLGLANTNQGIIAFIEMLLQKFGVRTHFYERPIGKTSIKHDGSIITPRKPIFNLVIHDKTSIRLFAEAIGFSIERKQKRLMEAIK